MRINLYQNPAPAPTGNQDDFFAPYMDTFLLSAAKDPLGLVVVLPGGGYSHRAYHEGDPIAMRFNELGFHAVVVQYRVKPYTYPAGLNDVARAIRIIRQNATAWAVDPDKIAVCGFGNIQGISDVFPVASVEQHPFLIGIESYRQLVNKIRNPELVVKKLLEVDLVQTGNIPVISGS